ELRAVARRGAARRAPITAASFGNFALALPLIALYLTLRALHLHGFALEARPKSARCGHERRGALEHGLAEIRDGSRAQLFAEHAFPFGNIEALAFLTRSEHGPEKGIQIALAAGLLQNLRIEVREIQRASHVGGVANALVGEAHFGDLRGRPLER